MGIENYVPSWACSRWGQHEHDWMDCSDCVSAQEEWLESGEDISKNPPLHYKRSSPSEWAILDGETVVGTIAESVICRSVWYTVAPGCIYDTVQAALEWWERHLRRPILMYCRNESLGEDR